MTSSRAIADSRLTAMGPLDQELALGRLSDWGVLGATLAAALLGLRRRSTRAWALFLGFLAVAYARMMRKYKNARLAWLLKRFLFALCTRVLPAIKTKVVNGPGSASRVGELVKGLQCKKPLIVTDKVLVDLGLLRAPCDSLKSASMEYEVYDGVLPDPEVAMVEDAFALYQRSGCDSLIAVGGGSAIDTAKMVSVKAGNPKPVTDYDGYFLCTNFNWSPPAPLVALPTTAGTGSDYTPGAVISVKAELRKLVIVDPFIYPSYAVHDPNLLAKLPKSVTAATGMDALTHAVESYLNKGGTDLSRQMSRSATAKVFRNLFKSFQDGSDIEARANMLAAAYEAGIAISWGHVGYVHAIAHQLGVLFHVPHGTANAMVLPYVLDSYIKDPSRENYAWCVQRLAQLAVHAGLATCEGSSLTEQRSTAAKFVGAIWQLRCSMDMPTTVEGMTMADVDDVTRRAQAENSGSGAGLCTMRYWVDLGYPVPMYFSYEECAEIVAKLVPMEIS